MEKLLGERFWKKVEDLCVERHISRVEFLKDMGEDAHFVSFFMSISFLPPSYFVEQIAEYFALPFESFISRKEIDSIFFEGPESWKLYKVLRDDPKYAAIARGLLRLSAEKRASLLLGLKAMGIGAPTDDAPDDEGDSHLLDPDFPNTTEGWRNRASKAPEKKD